MITILQLVQVLYFLLFGVQLINDTVIVSGVQQCDSIIHIHVPVLFQILFLFRLLHNIEQSSLIFYFIENLEP